MENSETIEVALAKAGDRDAFRQLVERHGRALFRLAYRMTGNTQDAEDVVQESFLRAYRQLDRFDERARFGTWLYRIAANCALDLIRGRKRRNERQEPADTPALESTVAAGDPSPERQAFSGEVQSHVTRAMAELSPAERTAFVLRHFEGVAVEEIARVLGIESGAARHSIFRAVQKLRRALEPVVGAAR